MDLRCLNRVEYIFGARRHSERELERRKPGPGSSAALCSVWDLVAYHSRL